MRINLFIPFLFLLIGASLSAQNLNDELESHTPKKIKTRYDDNKLPEFKAYKLMPNIGDTIRFTPDTIIKGYYHRTQMEGKYLGVSHTGNIGSPSQPMLFIERKESRDFVYADVYDPFISSSDNLLFYDARIPQTYVTYLKAWPKENSEEFFSTKMVRNFGKSVNVGGTFNYIYSLGNYNFNHGSQIDYNLFSSVRLERYSANFYLSNFNNLQAENGGIVDTKYITNPEDFTDGKRDLKSKDIPTRLRDTWNRVKGKQVFISQNYSLGFRKKSDVDSIPGEFVPVTTLNHTFIYEDNFRRFKSKDTETNKKYTNNFLIGNSSDSFLPNDTSFYRSFKNTISISLQEGFHHWAKFGLSAFLRQENRRYKLMDSIPMIENVEDENSTFIGGVLSRRTGKILNFELFGEFGVLGYDLGEFRLDGKLTTSFPFLKKTASLKAFTKIHNTNPAFYTRHHHGAYFWWDNDFSKIRHVALGGEVNLGFSNTNVSLQADNINNFIYYDTDGLPKQWGKNLQVLTLRAKQKLHLSILNWDNEVAWQKVSDANVLRVPELIAYSNLYLDFKIAKVLTVQMGIDGTIFTRYKAPYYEPATQKFMHQDNIKVGDYPLVNAYANFHLKQTRFFIQIFNIAGNVMKPDYFSMAYYPYNPQILKVGLCVNFKN